MALPNPWELNSDSDTTMIPFDQLKAQGMKYTPEQMAAFDRGRGRILASEVNEAQSNPGLESPPQSEIAHLNPTAYNSFSDRVSNPTTTDSGDTGPKPWDLPQEKTSFDKVAEKYPTLAKGIKATANALDVIPGSPGSEMMTALNRGVDIGKSLSNNGVLASIGKGARYAGDFALGAGEGISQGVGQGAAALLQTLSLDPRSNTDLAQERQTVGSLKSLLPKAFQDEIEHSLGSQDAQHLLSLPWEMSGDFVVNQLKQAGHTDLAGSVEQLLLAGAMLMGGKGKKGAKEVAAEEDKPASNPNATAVDDILGESGTSATGEAPPMFTIKGKKIADEGHGYATNVTPEEMTSEFDSRQGGFNFDPLERGESGDMLGPNIRGTQDVTTGLSPDEMYARRPIDSPAQGDLDLTNNPTPKADIAKQTIADLEKGKGLKPTTNGPDVPYQAMADLPEQGDVFDAANQSAWERYKARVAARQNATRYDNVGGTYQEPIVPPIVEGGSGKPLGQARRYGKQGGAVNMGFADEVAKRIENLKKGLQNISRDRESFGVGDTVRLMNGKTGSITAVKDGRFQIKGKDFVDSVPVQGIDYKYKPAGMVNSSVGYPKAQPHPLGGVGKRQGGAIDPDTFLGMFPKFNGSKVVDALGKLKAVFHGTSKDTDFKQFKAGQRGIWFTEKPQEASEFARNNDSQGYKYNYDTGKYEIKNTASRVHQVYLDIKRPYEMTPADIEAYKYVENYAQYQRDFFNKLKQQGYDGVKYPGGTWVAFKPEQVASAISQEVGKKKSKSNFAIDHIGPEETYHGKHQWNVVDKANGEIMDAFNTQAEAKAWIRDADAARERDLNPNDGKFGQGGAIKLGAFWSKKPKATTSDSSLEPHQAKDVPVPLSKEAQVDIIYRMYARARNPEDFRNNLRLVNKRNSNFPIDAVNRSNELWAKFESGYRPEKSIYSQMDSMNKRDVIALRPIEQAMKEIKVGDKSLDKVKLKDGDDLGYISKEFSSPMHIITLNWGKPVAELFANVHGELTDMTAMWNDRLGEWMNNNKPYIKLDRKSQIAVDRAEEFWDNHQVLTDRGLMWPTKEMLMDKNYTKLTEAEAEAYLKHADGYVDAYKAAGIERPPIPGYMPHVWKGSYRVNITGPKGLVGVQRTTFRWQANKIAKDMEKKGYHAEVVDPQVSNKGDYIRVMEETLLQAQKYGKLGANVAKKIEGELYGSLEGTITESLERRGIAGFVRNELSPNFNVLHPLDSINKGIKTRINNNIRSGLFEQSMNDFARAGRNAQIIESVAKPFYQNIGNMRQAKNLIDSVSDMISVATGMRRLEVSAPDRWGKRMLIKMGLPPNGIRDFVQAANAYARIQRINSFNLGFTAEHLYFGLPGLLDLRRMDLDRAAAGEKTGSYLKAIGTFSKDFVTFGQFRSPEGMRVEKWARDNGVYGSHYYDEPAFKSTTGKVVGAMTHGALMLVVNRMKSVNFHMAYRYFKDVMPENEALQAAKQHVKKTMQSFEPLDRPEVFNEGTAGLAVRTFNQIKLYNLSRIGEMLKSIGDSVKQGSYGAAAGHMVNLIGLAGLFTALGGAAGIPFHDDWEFIRKWGQEHLPTWNLGGQSVWQSYEELMSRAGIPNFIIMGMFPKLTGMDTRHTFEINLSNVFSGAGVEAVGAFTELALSRLGALITGKENPADIYKAKTKLLPTTAVPWIQDEAAKHLNGNIPNNRLEPTTPRTEEEDLIYKITSKKAISESQRNEFQSILKDIDARNTKIREAYLDLIVKKMSGFDTGRKDVNELIDDALHMNIGFDAQHLNEEIIKKIKEEHLSSAIKYIEEAAKGNNQNLKATRFRNMQMLLQGGQLGR